MPFNPGEDIVFLATDFNLLGVLNRVMMQSCFNFLFMLVLEKWEKCDDAITQLIGIHGQAISFAYWLELNGYLRGHATLYP